MFLQSGLGQSFATTGTITPNSKPILIQNFSSTFNSGSAGSTANYLICQVYNPGSSISSGNVIITLSTY